jgi:hypothetical protein
LYRDDLARLLGTRFPAQRWYHQRLAFWSGIWPEREQRHVAGGPAGDAGAEAEVAQRAALAETWVGDAEGIAPYVAPEGMYFIVVAARNTAALPAVDAGISLFTDAGDSELKRAESNAREVLRLDDLLKENDAALTRQAGHVEHLEALVAVRERLVEERDAAVTRHAAHVQHLERLVAERERIVVERDRQLADANAACGGRDAKIAALEKQLVRLEAERKRLEAALAAQERVIAFLQSFRGWIGWPSRHLRQWLRRAR